MTKFERIYQKLLKAYGPQGWWPLLDYNGTNPTKTGVIQGYHPGDYSFPKTRKQRFEICCGAILVQSTTWVGAEKALIAMRTKGLIDPAVILKTKASTLARAIRPAGYLNQKAATLRTFAQFFGGLRGRVPTRDQLIALKGIGNETADTMLCYAWGQTSFIVDAYAKRILSDLGLINHKWAYREIQSAFETNIAEDIVVYQEFHALIVEHAKRTNFGGAIKL